MHSVNWTIIIAAWEKFLALDRTSHNIAYERIPLGQVGCEVHFLPLEAFSDAKPWESEI